MGIGVAFAEKVQGDDEPIVDSIRKRAGTATQTLSRLSSTAYESTAPVIESTTAYLGSFFGSSSSPLSLAVQGLRVKDIAIPSQELVCVESHQKVGEVEKILRDEHIHSVPVWNAGAKRFEGMKAYVI